MEINNIREKIDKIDKDMAKLFEERMLLSKEVANYKKEKLLPIVDKKREEEVVKKNCDYIEEKEIKQYYINFMEDVMMISKNYQEKIMSGIKVAYCGAEGAYAYIAATKMYKDAKYINKNSFQSAYNAVVSGECDACVLPIENSFAGDVGEVMDLMFSKDLYVNKIFDLDITHNLLVNRGAKIEDIKKISSHPQALAQCSEFIEKNNFEVIEDINTALAAQKLKENNKKDMAVIASKETANIYGLEVLKENINNVSLNTTRFASFERVINEYEDYDASQKNFIIVFTVKNEAGALAKCLDIIGANGFNMRNLRSRPMKSLIWRYFFFCEIEGDINSKEAKDMFTALRVFCDRLKIVGAYIS